MHSLSIWVVFAMLITVMTAKLSSYLSERTPPNFSQFMFLSPVLSTSSWKKRKPFKSMKYVKLGFRAGLISIIAILVWWTYLEYVPNLKINWIVQSYLALAPLYTLGQLLSIILELVFGLTGWHYPAHFQFPPLAKNLTEFWGRRWASWVADWLKQMVFRRYRSRPLLGLSVSFFYSGIWHELLINVPLYLFCGVNLLGSQLLYFFIQAAAILGERKFNCNTFCHRLYLWIFVLVPAPLVVNEGVLRVTGLFFPR